MKTAVLILNIFGLNCISRFITGHIGTGILVLLIDVFSIVLISNFVGWILIGVSVIIWIVDLVTVCTNKWTHNGVYLGDEQSNNTKYNVNYNINLNKNENEVVGLVGNLNHPLHIAPNKNVIESHSQTKKCPFCAEEIKFEAILCRFCGKEIVNEKPNQITEPQNKTTLASSEIEELEKLFDSTSDETEKIEIAKKLYGLGKQYYWRFIPR